MKFTCDEDLIALIGEELLTTTYTQTSLICTVVGVYKNNDWEGDGVFVLASYSDTRRGDAHCVDIEFSRMHDYCLPGYIKPPHANMCWVHRENIGEPTVKDKRWLSKQLVKEYGNVL